MQKLLSCVLSFCLLVTSVSPSLAQVVPFRAVTRAASSGAVKTSVPAAFKASLIGQIVKSEAAAALPLKEIASSALSLPQAETMSASILQDAVPSANKIHNEWLGLAVNFEDIARAHAVEAKQVLAEDLAHKQAVFAEIPHRDLSDFLKSAGKNEPTPAVQQVQDALADASAIALVGNAEDVSVLLSFYESAKGSVFEPTARAIVARGMLRYGTYEELNSFLQQAGDLGAFNEGIAKYAQENNLPVRAANAGTPTVDIPATLQPFLEREGVIHGLHANPSYEATRVWVELGRPAATPVAKETAAPVSRRQIPLEKIKIPTNVLAPARVSIAPQTISLAAKTPEKNLHAAQEKTTHAAAPVSATPKTPAKQNSSGILYGGLPIFEIEKGIKNMVAFFRKHHKTGTTEKAKIEEEKDLHENSVRPVFEEAVPAEVTDAEDALSVSQPELIEVEKDGYKLTLEDEKAVEHILRNVTLSVSPQLTQFSSTYNRLTLTNERIFELRNLVVSPSRPDHFFFVLNPENGALETLIKGTRTLKMPRPLRIKIQRTSSPSKTVSLRVYADDSLTEFVTADVDTKLLPAAFAKENSQNYLVQRADKLYLVNGTTGEEIALNEYFVRLPKEESKYWTKVFANNPNTPFALSLFSTKEKTFAWTYLVPTMQIGLGKTMAPELSSRTQLGESTSSVIMLGINNVLPILMGFVHKGLKRYGEAAIGRIGVGSFVAGSAIALASGLYGFLGDGMMSAWQTAGFVASSVMIAIGTNITRFVQNILISANRGKIVSQDSFKNAAKPAAKNGVAAQPVVYNGAYLGKRFKEVFTKSPSGSARDVVLFQTASMFKNLGTMLFLSFPWIANGAVKLATGVDLNLDFSASYVPYSLFSAWTLYKVCQTAYKDAIPTQLNLLHNNLQETKLQAFKEIFALKAEELTATSPVIIKAAKQLKSAIDSIGPVEARETGKKTADVIAQHREDMLFALASDALEQSKGMDFAQKAASALEEALENMGRREVKVFDVMKMAGIPASLTAMTLATFHELAVSNGFAFGMRAIVGRGATANALTALALYGSMSAGRILGNILSRRVSGGTMYAISSAMSVTGTALMAAANGSIGALISGAVIASFGVGNFFSQMYEYMTGLYPKYRREIALLINYTMPAAAVMTFPMRWLVNMTGISNLDLLISGAGLLTSLMLTPGMFANSSIVKAAQFGWKNMKNSVHNVFHQPKTPEPPTDLDDALPN